jgi:hypothetical protein
MSIVPSVWFLNVDVADNGDTIAGVSKNIHLLCDVEFLLCGKKCTTLRIILLNDSKLSHLRVRPCHDDHVGHVGNELDRRL